MKRVGNFIYLYSEDEETIIVSHFGTRSQSVAELSVKFQLLGKMFLVEGSHIDIEYQGITCHGVLYYNNVTEQELIEALSSTK